MLLVEWISVVKLDKSREAKIESYFDCPVEFLNPNVVSELNEILRFLKKIWTKYNNSNQRENIFHIFYPEKQNWRVIFCGRKYLTFFQALLSNLVFWILSLLIAQKNKLFLIFRIKSYGLIDFCKIFQVKKTKVV